MCASHMFSNQEETVLGLCSAESVARQAALIHIERVFCLFFAQHALKPKKLRFYVQIRNEHDDAKLLFHVLSSVF